MKITRYEARSGAAVARALKLSALGVLSLSAVTLVACGDANPTSSTPHIGGGGTSSTAGASNGTSGTIGTGNTGNTSSTAGATSTGGTTGTAGDSSIAGTTSTAGTDSGTAGAGGTTTVTTYPFCSPMATPVQTRVPLPLAATTVFTPSGYEGGDATMSGGGQIKRTDCADRSPQAIGACSTWTYTPAAAVAATPPNSSTWAGVAYILGYQSFGSAGHDPICLADGATAVTFYAKGLAGGEVVTFSAAGAMEQPFTLTNTWALYTIPISGVQYNTDAMGLTDGFFFKIGPASTTDTKVVAFEVDDIQYVGATGTGGMGGAGGTSSGGTGGAATGGAGGTAGAATGGAGAGGTAAGSGGTGGA